MKPRTAIIKALEGGDIGWTAEKLKATLELDEPVEELVRILKELRDGGYVTIKYADNHTYYYRTARLKGYLKDAMECPHCHEMFHKFGISFHARRCPKKLNDSTMLQSETNNMIALLQHYRRDTIVSMKAMSAINHSKVDIHLKAKEELIINIDTVLANLGVSPPK